MCHERRVRYGGIPLAFILFVPTMFAMMLLSFFPNVAAQPSIAIDMEFDLADVEPGDNLNCTMYFNNTGFNSSAQVWINVSFPSSLVYLWDNSASEGGIKSGDYNWTFPNVAAGGHSYFILFNVTDRVQDGELLTVYADLDYLDELSNPMPPSSSFATATARTPVMSVTKTAETYSLSPDQIFNYTISFQNTGGASGAEVLINDTLPGTLAYLTDSASLIGGSMVSWMNWSFANVVGMLSFDVTVQVQGNLTGGTVIVNDLRLFYRNANGIWFSMESATNTTVVSLPGFTLTKMVDKASAYVGDLLEYTLSFSNVGVGRAREVWVNDTIPNGTTYYSSSPLCDSLANNKCTWTLFDLGPGAYQLLLTVRINATVPPGSIIDNIAVLNYTDPTGKPTEGLWSSNKTVVQDSYLSIVVQDRARIATPFDTLDIDVLLRNRSPQPSLKAWLNVTFPQEIQYVSDNTAVIGGSRTGPDSWEFSSIPQGNHSFRIVARIIMDTSDGTGLQIGIELDHTDATGAGLPTITDEIAITVQAPILSPYLSSAKEDYRRAETPVITIFLNNTGSTFASSIWVNLSVPASVKHLSDTSDSIGGVRQGDFEFLVCDLGTGVHSFEIQLDIGGVAETRNIVIWLFVNYTDSNGDLIDQASERVSFEVIVPAEEFPMYLLVLIALIAFCMSLAYASKRETVKYSFLIFIVPLFSRLRREEVLDHETRGMIRGYILANPGDHFNSIKSTLDLKNGTLAHHLHILEREKIVKSVKDGKYRRFFPIGMKVKERAFPTKMQAMILDIVEETPGITQKDIASQLGISQPTISYHIAKLKKSKRLRTEKHGMSMKHYLEDVEE